MHCNIIAAYDADPPGVPMPLIEALLRDARARLNSAGGEAVDADLLLAPALGRGRAWLYAHAGDDLADATAQAFPTPVQRARKSVVAGKSVDVRLSLGGRRNFKNKQSIP